MTKKSKEKYVTSIKTIKLDQHSVKNTPSTIPINLKEQKEKFLKNGQTPYFVHNAHPDHIQEITSTGKGQIRFEYLGEAEYILKQVKDKYGTGDNYLLEAYGERISVEQAHEKLTKYLEENLLNESLTVIWCKNLGCSAKMMWTGPTVKNNKPESRRYTLWLNSSEENPYLREKGLESLLDHEIGTHFIRMFNDGLQPWYSNRKTFGLRGMSSLETLRCEEGLATINSALGANIKYLWLAALVYYTACKSTEMKFKQLFDHLAQFVSSREQRWKHVMRVKRGLADPNDLGGYGKDQCYFEGAIKILRNIDDIDLHIFMSGKLCLDEVQRVKRLARKDCIKLPAFLKNPEKYKKRLRHMAALNGLHLEHPKREPPLAYLQRLQQRKNKVGVSGGDPIRKVRRKSKSQAGKWVVRKSDSTSSQSSTSDSNLPTDVTKKYSPEKEKVIVNPLTGLPAIKSETKHKISLNHVPSCHTSSSDPTKVSDTSKDTSVSSSVDYSSRNCGERRDAKINLLTVSTDTIQAWRIKCTRSPSAKSERQSSIKPNCSKQSLSNNTSVSETAIKPGKRGAHEDKYFGCLNLNPEIPQENRSIFHTAYSKPISPSEEYPYVKIDKSNQYMFSNLQQEIPLSMFGGVSQRELFQQQLAKVLK